MLRDLFRFLVISAILLCMENSFSGQMKSSDSHELQESSWGTYSIIQLGREIGKEKFSRKVFADNTLVMESYIEISPAGKDTLYENIHMVLDEDSYFARSYTSIKKVAGFEHEISIEMFANIARIKRNSRSGDTAKANSRTRTVIVSTGSLFLQQGITSQLGLLLKRFNSTRRGPQNLLVFDPISAKESSVLVSYSTSLDTIIAGTKDVIDTYKVIRQGAGSIKLYVDSERKIIRAFDNLQRMEFILTDFAVLKD